MNKLLSVLKVKFSDGSAWEVPCIFIAIHRAKYFADKETGNDWYYIFYQEFGNAIYDSHKMIDWVKNNMSWDDVKNVAIKTLDNKPFSYDSEFANADMEIKEK